MAERSTAQRAQSRHGRSEDLDQPTVLRDNPQEAIRRLAVLRSDASAYVRKSVGNALRDISKKYPELVAVELGTWNLETKEVSQVYRLASKVIERG